MIPDFTEEGLLPPGVHGTTLEEVEREMGWSAGRRRLIEGLKRAWPLLVEAGVERVYLDGSFVTDKDRPNDIDGCYDVAPHALRKEILGRMYPVWPPTPENRAKARQSFGLDFFRADSIELGSGEPFVEFFQRDRQDRRRGVLMIELITEEA